MLFNTLLEGNEGVEEGLVQKDSPFAGTREFGMCWFDRDTSQMAMVGTKLHIEQYTHEPDGRLYVTSKGTQRFKVTKIVKQAPVLICEVEALPDDDDSSDKVSAGCVTLVFAF